MASKIVKMIGDVNGVNTSFSTPTKFVADSLRVLLNGQAYEPDDDKYGWSEDSDQTIILITPPRTNDIIQAFYEDKTEAGQIGVEGVVGSPFSIDGTYP
jgi:hypothetical protein